MQAPTLETHRLRQLLDLAPPGARVADVGADHALLACALVSQGIAPRAIATDLRPGPLDRARANVRAHALGDRVALRLGDGLDPLGSGEVDVVVLAGMGPKTIARILRTHDPSALGVTTLLVQTPKNGHELRRFLWNERRWHIEQETLLHEQGHYYHTFRVDLTRPADPPYEALSELERLLGPHVIATHPPALDAFVAHQLRRLRVIHDGMRESQTPDALRLEQVQSRLEMLETWRAQT